MDVPKDNAMSERDLYTQALGDQIIALMSEGSPCETSQPNPACRRGQQYLTGGQPPNIQIRRSLDATRVRGPLAVTASLRSFE